MRGRGRPRKADKKSRDQIQREYRQRLGDSYCAKNAERMRAARRKAKGTMTKEQWDFINMQG